MAGRRKTVEVATSLDAPIGSAMSREERQRLIAEIATQHPAAAERLGIKLSR